jgi:hypothetical protein
VKSRMTYQRKRAFGLVVAAVVTAVLAVVPFQAFAGTRDAGAATGQATGQTLAAGGTNLTLQFQVDPGPGGSTRYTISVLNNGPDDLLDGDYQVVVEWPVGQRVGQSGDTPCVESNARLCVMDGVAVEFFEGPVTGPGEVDYRITLSGVNQGFIVNIREINFFMIRDEFPDFGIQPPVLCFGNDCDPIVPQ